MKLFAKKIIYGCESRGDGDSPYLTRFTVFGSRWGSLYVHIFHRSDADDMHDHPWPFVSLIVWRGYVEETPLRLFGMSESAALSIAPEQAPERKRVWPGMLLFRRAQHIHRVELVNGRPAVSLVLTGPVQRKWGFWVNGAWEYWRSYFERLGC